MYDNIKAFKCKLFLWERQIMNDDLTHFPTCNNYKTNLNNASYKKYSDLISNLRTDFETRFQDFNSLEDKFSLFSTIFSINIDLVPRDMQMEVIEIQCNSN